MGQHELEKDKGQCFRTCGFFPFKQGQFFHIYVLHLVSFCFAFFRALSARLVFCSCIRLKDGLLNHVSRDRKSHAVEGTRALHVILLLLLLLYSVSGSVYVSKSPRALVVYLWRR
jgi:cytochrome b561